MTTLDRAFIKAFASTAPASAPIDETAAAPRPPQAAEHKPKTAAATTDESDIVMASLVEPEGMHAALPLSRFAAQPKVHDSVRASQEVDRADWPQACSDLLQHATRDWDRFTEQLIERMGEGQKCIALASAVRGEGRTTIALALAKHAAGRGLRPVVVDADPENPALVRCCKLSVRTGWDDLVGSELAMGEALITAVEDGVTLMPWRGPAVALSQLAGALRTASIFGTLREHYDLVLLDTAPLVGQTTIADFASFAKAIHLDALYLLQNARSTSREQLTAACSKLRRAGLPVAGVIENFVSNTSGDGPSRIDPATGRHVAAHSP